MEKSSDEFAGSPEVVAQRCFLVLLWPNDEKTELWLLNDFLFSLIRWFSHFPRSKPNKIACCWSLRKWLIYISLHKSWIIILLYRKFKSLRLVPRFWRTTKTLALISLIFSARDVMEVMEEVNTYVEPCSWHCQPSYYQFQDECSRAWLWWTLASVRTDPRNQRYWALSWIQPSRKIEKNSISIKLFYLMAHFLLRKKEYYKYALVYFSTNKYLLNGKCWRKMMNF